MALEIGAHDGGARHVKDLARALDQALEDDLRVE